MKILLLPTKWDHAHYFGPSLPGLHCEFVPFALTPAGTWGPKTKSWFQGLCSKIRNPAFGKVPDAAEFLDGVAQANAMNMAMATISASVHRGNSDALMVILTAAAARRKSGLAPLG